MKLSRRSFIKLVGATGAGLSLTNWGFDVQPLEAASNECRIHGAREYTSICNFCSCGCGMICHVRDGKLINLEGDPDHVISRGSLCSKGASQYQVPYAKHRGTTPLYRAPGSDRWEEIDWDTAINKIAQKMKDTRDDHWIAEETIGGKTYKVNRIDALGFLGGAQVNNEECYLFTKMSRALGASFIEHQARV